MHGLQTSYLNKLPLLHFTFMLNVLKMQLKGKVGGCAFKSHGNCIVDHGKIMELCLNFRGKPVVKSAYKKNNFSYFSTKTYVVGTQKNRLNETVLLSTQNIC